ncbi:MAG: hypothetical protein Kow0059_08280 [Candidatus Sumerlaeia bacterium]
MKDIKIHKPAPVCSLCGKPLQNVARHPSILRWMERGEQQERPLSDPDEAVDRVEQGQAGRSATDPAPTGGQDTSRPHSPPSATDEDARSVPARIDLCPDCWSRDHRLDYFCYWLARREPPKPSGKKDRRARNAFLRELFYHYYNNEHLSPGESGAFDRNFLDAEDQPPAPPPPLDSDSPSAQDGDRPDRQRDLYLYLLAHLLMRFKVFQWKGRKTSRGRGSRLLFLDPAIGQTLDVPDHDPDDPALVAVQSELAALLDE